MKCLLVYDISNDNTRTRIADFCLDYGLASHAIENGLDRIQYSAFLGDLSRTHREELILKIGDRLGDRSGKVQLFAICKTDWRQRLEIIQENESGE